MHGEGHRMTVSRSYAVVPPDDALVLERVYVEIELDQMQIAKGVMKRRRTVLRELGK